MERKRRTGKERWRNIITNGGKRKGKRRRYDGIKRRNGWRKRRKKRDGKGGRETRETGR